jgi:CRISPR system Cascade subunit CasC
MLIEIHMIQNHSPANLNRDDLGAPKTCYFGGVLRSRISSQCLKRSIRMGPEFGQLRTGVATRRLAQLVAERLGGAASADRISAILGECGLGPKKASDGGESTSAGRIFTTEAAVDEMVAAVRAHPNATHAELAKDFARIIATRTTSPDMALCGRMLEPKKVKEKSNGKIWGGESLNVEASLQVAHAFSTHEARPEVDYFTAADDIPGGDAGAAFVDEAMFASACFYKYFSINFCGLVKNLGGAGHELLAAHTVGAFLRGAALTNPTGKQNSFAAHNPPDGILVEVKREARAPVSYANAFAAPVPTRGDRDLVAQSIAQLAGYVHDIDAGYGKPDTWTRFWFSPNLRHPLTTGATSDNNSLPAVDHTPRSLDELVRGVVGSMGYDWAQARGYLPAKEPQA